MGGGGGAICPWPPLPKYLLTPISPAALQQFQGLAGRPLFRLLLGAALAPGQGPAQQGNLHQKMPGVAGTAFRQELVGGRGLIPGLGEFLQRGLEVLPGGGGQGFQVRGEQPVGEAGRSLQAPVQKDGGQDGFQGVGQERWLVPAGLLLFTPAQQEMNPQVQLPGQGGQLPGVHQGGPPSGKFSFRTLGKGGQQQVADGEGEHRIPQKLQLFVAGAVLRILVGIRAVAQGPVQQAEVLEPVPQSPGQIPEFPLSSLRSRRPLALQ